MKKPRKEHADIEISVPNPNFGISIPKKGAGSYQWQRLEETFHTVKSARLRLKTMGVRAGLIHTPDGDLNYTPYQESQEVDE